MTDDNSQAEAKATREVSTIGFPYLDLDDGIAVAKAMLAAGGVPLDRDQLASQMGQVPTSGNFNMKLSAARLFGLIDSPSGKYQLTPLGFEILDPARERAAKAAAFLQVPLYRRLYDEFKGKMLPPRPVALENTFVSYGVARKQKDKARHAFERSARIAGYFANGSEDRLVAPVVGRSDADQESAKAVEPPAAAENSGRPPATKMDPLVKALFDRLPKTEEGVKTPWPVAERGRWLQAANLIFDMIYEGDDGDVDIRFSSKS